MTKTMTVDQRLARILLRTEKSPTGCLLWTGPVSRDGYAHVKWAGSAQLAHRLVYQLERGEIPLDRPVLDHACHTAVALYCDAGVKCVHRRCLNVDHLEPVTAVENARRQRSAHLIACHRGHPFVPENTYVWHGSRHCRACRALRKGQSA